MRCSLLYLLLVLPLFTYSQGNSVKKDSLLDAIETYNDFDTNKVVCLIMLAEEVEQESFLLEQDVLKEALRQAKGANHFFYQVEVCLKLGTSYYFSGSYEEAEETLIEAAEIAKEHELHSKFAQALLDLGQIEDALGKMELSIQHTMEAIEILEEKEDFKMLVAAYINLAGIYYYRDYNQEALDYYIKAKEILIDRLSLKDNYINWAVLEANIGWCYYYMDDMENAVLQLKRAVDIHTKYDYYTPQSANARANLASMYVEFQEFDLAKIHCNDALDISMELDYIEGVGNAYNVLGEIANAEKKYSQAAENYIRALDFATAAGDLYDQAGRASSIAKVYSQLGNYKLAYTYILLSKELNDSITEIETNAAFEDAVTKYETEKAEAQNELLQKEAQLKDVQIEQERQEAQAEQERQWIIGGSIGVLLVFGLFFLINRNRLKTKTNRQLEQQRDEIAEQKKEITDSITYAKHIQNSFLPSEEDFHAHFEDSFLMYQPKDIVAGDFYILEEAGGYVFFSVADCTGHGVPGAMVSIVCNNAIRKVLHELNEYDPGRILDKARDIVIAQFERKGHVVNDGMDISFCRLNKETLELHWAGANNALLLVKNGGQTLNEIKPNKQPIGGYVTSDPFTTHKVQLDKGDLIYMTSDGYPDQFGGEKGKKYKYRRFKELLLKNAGLDLKKQKANISSEFFEWKAGFEQIDDVCVMGVKV